MNKISGFRLIAIWACMIAISLGMWYTVINIICNFISVAR